MSFTTIALTCRATVFGTAVFLAAVATHAQQGRGGGPPLPTTGTAELVGRVVTDEANPRPVRRAVITLQMASVLVIRSTSTDDAGQFRLTNLPAGSYSAPRANKPGYVMTTFGEKRPGGLGTPITLIDGQKLEIVFRLKRGAVITGAVMDEGRPSAFTSVQAIAVRTVDGKRVAGDMYYIGGGYAMTDDRGVYRMYGLAPGEYIVSAQPRFTSAAMAPARVITEAEMQWAQQQFQGAYGSAASPTSTSDAAAPPPPAPAVAQTPVYYPGTTVLSQASSVTLAPGQERGGVDFALQTVPTAKVEGLVIGPDGQPAQSAQLTLVPRGDATANSFESMMMMESMMMSRPSVVDGKFSIQSVKPGEYTIAARGAARSNAPAPSSGRGGPQQAMNLWASADVSVNGTDVSGVVLRLTPGIDIRGRVALEGDTTAKPVDFSTLTVRLQSAPGPGVVVAVGVPSAPVEADGSFTLKGVTPGRYLVYSYIPGGSPTPHWTLKSARVGEVDAADVAFEVEPSRDTPDIIVTFTDKAAELSGRLVDQFDKPSSQFSIMLFPADKAMWSQRSRRIRQPVRTGLDGTFKFTQLVPGEYLLAALPDFDFNDIYKPEYLEQVAASAMKITIGEGEKKVQNLKIAGGYK